MTRTQLLQEIRRMRFVEAYVGWQALRLTQGEAARLLGVCDRTFRRYVDRYEDEGLDGLDGLVDKRLGQVSARRGMMLHQDGSTHEWVPARQWDLIITLDDATSAHYSMFFVEEEGTASSFRGMAEVIETQGLPSSLYTDRGSHYWFTPEAGGKVDRDRPTQFGRAMRQLDVQMIPAYSPEARGRCERMFWTHQGRLPKELAARGIDTMEEANRYLAEHYRVAFNEEFAVPAAETGSAFVPFIGSGLADILCEHHERTVNRDNCVRFEGRRLQIPAQAHRCHFIKARVRVHRYPDGHLAVFHGPRKLAASTTSPPPSPSAERSSLGTTPSIAMAGSRCSPRTTSIIIEPRACWTSAGGPFKPPGPGIPNASFEASQNQTPFPKQSGSTHP